MATAVVVRAEVDCLRRKTLSLSDKDFSKSRNRKRSHLGFQSNKKTAQSDHDHKSLVDKLPGTKLAMGQVLKILKRGETLNNIAEKKKKADHHDVSRKGEEENQLRPDIETTQKKIKLKDFDTTTTTVEFYAGAGCLLFSPLPSSVPIPSFLGRTARTMASS